MPRRDCRGRRRGKMRVGAVMKRWVITIVGVLGIVLIAMLMLWRLQARSASQLDVVSANLGFALAVVEAESARTRRPR